MNPYKDNIKYAYDYMTNNLGYSEIVARAIIGNLMQESSLNPNAKNKIGATGIAQWLGERKDRLMKIDNWKDISVQLNFLDWEFKNTHKKAWENLNNAKTLSEATMVVRKEYEIPGEKEAMDHKRISYANFDENTFEIPDSTKTRQKIYDNLKSQLLEKKKRELRNQEINSQILKNIQNSNLPDSEKDLVNKMISDPTKKWTLLPSKDKKTVSGQIYDSEGNMPVKSLSVNPNSNIKDTPLGEEAKNKLNKALSQKDTTDPLDLTEEDIKYLEEETTKLFNQNYGINEKTSLKPPTDEEIKIAKEIEEDLKNKKLIEYDKKFNSFINSLGADEPNQIKTNDFSYNPENYKKDLPLEAISMAALGLKGLAGSDPKIPLMDEKIDSSLLAYLEENKRLSKLGLPPELEAKAKRELADSTHAGIEMITRASRGDRNLILGNIGALDYNKQKAIIDLNIADLEARDRAFQRYGETLKYIDDFQKKQNAANYNIKLQQILEDKNANTQLANSAFANLINEIQYQKENGPGSANDMLRKTLEYELNGEISGHPNDGTPGSKIYKEDQIQKQKDYNSKILNDYKNQNELKNLMLNLSTQDKIALVNSGIDPASLNSIEDVQNAIQSPIDITPKGFKKVDFLNLIDGDSGYDQNGEKIRLTGEGDVFINHREWNDPNSTRLDWRSSYLTYKPLYMKNTGRQDAYGRKLSELRIGFPSLGVTLPWENVAAPFDPLELKPFNSESKLSIDNIILKNKYGYF